MTTAPRPRASVRDLAAFHHRAIVDARGALTPIELVAWVPFSVVRIFWIAGVPVGTSRGGHAHKTGAQYLICLSGRIEVEATDGAEASTFDLGPGDALHLPPAIWASERYLTADTVLLVLCDRPFAVEDYLGDIEAVRSFRREALS